jgi:hypothetical protein
MTLFATSSNLVTNGGFDSGLIAWNSLWTRTPNAGTVALETAGGRTALRIEHTGSADWSLNPTLRVRVQPGDLFRLSVWIAVEGSGNASLSVVTYDDAGNALDWSYIESTLCDAPAGRMLEARFATPVGVAEIQPRLIGVGPATIRLDDFALEREGNAMSQRNATLAPAMTLENDALKLVFHTTDGVLSVLDKRTLQIWDQRPVSGDLVVTDATLSEEVRATLLHASSGETLRLTVALDGDKPECLVSLAGDGSLPSAIRYPHPFVTGKGTALIVPMNEGISYPVDDATIEPMQLIAYGGHGICMAFWGVTDGVRGQMAILETPDDAAVQIDRVGGNLAVAPVWQPQKGRFGYERRLRYCFLDSGGYVAMCKRYRAHARETGLLRTLEEKRAANPDVDLLAGAVNVWRWDGDAVETVREMRSLGMERILWSNRQSPETIRTLNEMGVLTSRYDIYQDVMNPAVFPKLWGVHPDWPTEAWDRDLMVDASGNWIRGWKVQAGDGVWYACGVLCDRRAPDYARKRIADELATHPYRCRFIDTTTASPWRECYHPEHPVTRTESRFTKMALLKTVSEEFGLVTGSETGHDAAVPYVHYFEGMLSLGPYRVPDSGRDMMRVWDEPPERVVKFQVGHAYRLPLWELVYHDCVVSHWYWGDYNNKLPSLWDKRDLFNLLYGTPPMFMFNEAIWESNKTRFAQSYRNICPVVREVAYAEMTDHRGLTSDRTVQQTTFGNGVRITVNFGSRAYRDEQGSDIVPMGFRIERDVIP